MPWLDCYNVLKEKGVMGRQEARPKGPADYGI